MKLEEEYTERYVIKDLEEKKRILEEKRSMVSPTPGGIKSEIEEFGHRYNHLRQSYDVKHRERRMTEKESMK